MKKSVKFQSKCVREMGESLQPYFLKQVAIPPRKAVSLPFLIKGSK